MRLVSEQDAEADPMLAAGFKSVRQHLQSTFVPSIYRTLAVDPAAFNIAVEILPSVADLARATDFTNRACRLADEADESPDQSGSRESIHLDEPSREVLLRYQDANPINLLLALALLGTAVPEWPQVMAPPLPLITVEAGGLAAQIALCHGGVLLPGAWRELCEHTSARASWQLVLAAAVTGRVRIARQTVRSFAESVLLEGKLASAQGAVGGSLGPNFAHLGWFPTGIATMVVEVQWILNADNFRQSKASPSNLEEMK